jgi:hypothetical protein
MSAWIDMTIPEYFRWQKHRIGAPRQSANRIAVARTHAHLQVNGARLRWRGS